MNLLFFFWVKPYTQILLSSFKRRKNPSLKFYFRVKFFLWCLGAAVRRAFLICFHSCLCWCVSDGFKMSLFLFLKGVCKVGRYKNGNTYLGMTSLGNRYTSYLVSMSQRFQKVFIQVRCLYRTSDEMQPLKQIWGADLPWFYVPWLESFFKVRRKEW